jgi:hypothetical protein
MRLAVLLGVFGLIATSLSLAGEEFSQVHDLPPLKMGAKDLDAILLKTHSLIDSANGPEELGRESVKIDIHSQDIEIPHLSVASSLAFPNEVFGFSYTYSESDKPISLVSINFGDALRRVTITGGSADKVQALSKLLEKEFHSYSTAVGGVKFRHVAGICLSMLFLCSLMISAAYCWNNRDRRMALGMPVCSAIGFLLLLFVPWDRFLPGFVLYQRYSRFFALRHVPEIFAIGLMAMLAGIPLFYFLSRKRC